MRADSGRWTEVTPSRFVHEREGLEFVRDNLPSSEPYHAWSNFEFIDKDGRQYEVDLLVLGPAGLHLVELKAWAGRITGNDYDWLEHNPGLAHPKRRGNPLGLTSTKAKALKEWLERAAKRLGHNVEIPFVHESLFLHGAAVDARGLPENVRQLVFGRDDATNNGMRRIVVDRLGMPPRRGGPLGSPQRKSLERLLTEIGLRRRSREIKVGQWVLDDEQLGSGWGWVDHRAHHATFGDQRARVRRWFVPEGSGAGEVALVQQAARREYEQLYGLSHPGLVAPTEYHEMEGAAAGLVFKDVEGAVPLSTWVDGDGAAATIEVRLHVVRELAEVIRYAHGHGLAHRGLDPSSVSVCPQASGMPRVLVRDWQSAGSADAASSTTTHHARDLADHAAESDRVYAAPEVLRGMTVDRRLADVFSVGALSYLVITGKAPAADEASLRARLESDEGLMLSADVDSPLEALEDAVWSATCPRVHERCAGIDQYLTELDQVLNDITSPPEDSGLVDPVEAVPGDLVADDMIVVRRLGEGSTSIALLVEREDGQQAVLKAARDDNKAERLKEEAATLERVPPSNLVARLMEPVLDIGGRTSLLIELAGEQSLSAEISRHGPASTWVGLTAFTCRWPELDLNSRISPSASGIELLPTSLGPHTRVTPVSANSTVDSVMPR
ncbi:hypothetical protein HMPREF0063_10981 [Aeromicrobium marinum DSM 15272]|uniref:Protein kinase domain-containing protein n=1 Tax=Aeromicrobium marinum DSM 15272 TaxID=585531 RepID=E2SAJ1_9ACTN|nr:NERD domain-containing protein [Aeromicrobium marinum]EFQ84265.1 hypothetical protein HMPREF0063_10981 [Aeromicrobium marinum DSM 15272]